MILNKKYQLNTRFVSEPKRKRGVFKTIARRNPCRLIFAINFILLLLLITALYFVAKYFEDYTTKLNTFEREDKIISKFNAQLVSMNECVFEVDPSNKNLIRMSYNTTECKNYRRGADKFILVRRLAKIQFFDLRNFTLPPLCSSLVELMDCHESFPASVSIKKEDFRNNITECIGFGHYYSMTHNKSATVWAPSITNLEAYKDQLVFANDLIMRCPQCRPNSIPFNFGAKDEHFIKLSTSRRGWPVEYEYCKSTINVTLPEHSDRMLFDKIDQHTFAAEVELLTTSTTPE